MQALLVLLQILICLALVILILLQQGKGAEMGAAFGSGASNTMFGSPGASSFLFKLTAGLGALFFAVSLGLGYYDGLLAKRSQHIVIPETLIQQQLNQEKIQTQATGSTAMTTSVDTPSTTILPAPAPAVDQPSGKSQTATSGAPE
jgi:preprotein translocase subunit SecG